MWTVPIPACPADVSYRTCISRVRDKDLKKRLESAREEIRRVDVSYRKAAAERDFSELRPETQISGEGCASGVKWRAGVRGGR